MRLPRNELFHLRNLIDGATGNEDMWEIICRPSHDKDWEYLENYAIKTRRFVRPNCSENFKFIASLFRQIADGWNGGAMEEQTGTILCSECKFWVEVRGVGVVRCLNPESKVYGRKPNADYGCLKGEKK